MSPRPCACRRGAPWPPYRPGRWCSRVSSAVTAVCCPQVDRDEGFHWTADQFAGLIAEHIVRWPVDQGERALVIDQRQSVGKGIDKLSQHGGRDDRSVELVSMALPLTPGPGSAARQCRAVASGGLGQRRHGADLFRCPCDGRRSTRTRQKEPGWGCGSSAPSPTRTAVTPGTNPAGPRDPASAFACRWHPRMPQPADGITEISGLAVGPKPIVLSRAGRGSWQAERAVNR